MSGGLAQGIRAGVDYLHAHQQPSGRFRVWNSVDARLPADSTPEDSVFATACILYCLEWLHSPQMEQIRRKGLGFLQTETSARGLNRYYASSSQAKMAGGRSLPFTIPYDVDTTSCVSLLLRRYGSASENEALLLANRDEAGVFQTWLMQEPLPETDSHFPFVCLMPAENSVCTGVNANALCCLGESEATAAAAQHLLTGFCRGTYLRDSGYYADEMVLFYLYSRAYFEGVKSLGGLRQAMMEQLLTHQIEDGSFGTALQTALALCTGMNLGASWPGQDAAIQFLIASQAGDGSWARAPFYVGNPGKVAMKQYLCLGESRRELPGASDGPETWIKHFGSEEITTAYCLEALSRGREATR